MPIQIPVFDFLGKDLWKQRHIIGRAGSCSVEDPASLVRPSETWRIFAWSTITARRGCRRKGSLDPKSIAHSELRKTIIVGAMLSLWFSPTFESSHETLSILLAHSRQVLDQSTLEHRPRNCLLDWLLRSRLQRHGPKRTAVDMFIEL